MAAPRIHAKRDQRIVEQFRAGVPVLILGQTYGISRTRIYQILTVGRAAALNELERLAREVQSRSKEGIARCLR